MNKDEYKIIKDIKIRLAKGKETTFAERNIVNIYNKRLQKKQREAATIQSEAAKVNMKIHTEK